MNIGISGEVPFPDSWAVSSAVSELRAQVQDPDRKVTVASCGNVICTPA